MDQPTDDAELRWDVRSEQIDLDRWAQAVVKAAAGRKDVPASPTRWWIWPVLAIVVGALVWLVGPRTTLIAIVPFAFLVGTGLILGRQSPGSFAKHLRSISSAGEPFTFIADRAGTRVASRTGSSKLAWSRYTRAVLDDDLVVLVLEDTTYQVLPSSALTAGHAPAQAVEIMTSWMTSANADSTPDTRYEANDTVLDDMPSGEERSSDHKSVRWDVGSGQWAVGSGQWTVDNSILSASRKQG